MKIVPKKSGTHTQNFIIALEEKNVTKKIKPTKHLDKLLRDPKISFS